MSKDKSKEFNKTVLYFSEPKSDRSQEISYLKGSKLKSKD